MRTLSLNSIILFFSFCLFLFGQSSCRKEGYQKNEGVIWNTLYHITYESDKDLSDSIINVLNGVSKSLSVFEEGSLVNRVNKTDSIEIDELFAKVYNKSVEINRLSGGMFDPTVSPLVTAWGFGPGHSISADTARIDSLLVFVGINKTRLKENIFIKDDPRIEFNFSAIAKGLGCDEVGRMFRRNGVTNYMVEIGGELAISGKSPSGKDWLISIDAPTDENSENNHDSYLVIAVTDCGIATSGNYRNFHETDQGRISHTISPLTGHPEQSDVLSATIVASSCMEADGIATACMAMGSEGARKLLTENNIEGMLILSEGVWQTPGFEKLVSAAASERGNKGQN